MATTGAVTIDLNQIQDSVNNGMQLSEFVIAGVRDQGDLIGLAIGVSIAITLLFGVIVLVLGATIALINKVKGMKKLGR